MFAIRYAVREFKFYLASADILIETDHKPILAIFQKVDLTAKQSRWLNDMLGFQLTIRHIPGKTNELADYLSRLPLQTANIPQVIGHSIQVTFEQPWIETLAAQLKKDEFFGKIYDQVQEGESIEPYTMDDHSGFLYYKNRLCVPSSLYQQVLDDFHTSYLAGHPGVSRMTLWLTKHFYFPKMHTIIKDYVGTCDHCWQVKSKTFTPGSLQPLETPVSRWSHISMDIVSGFTPITAQGITYDSVLVTVDLFSNHVHFTPINANFSGDNLVEYLVTRFFPLHGFPQVFVGDQGPQFTSALFTQVLENLGINYRFSVAKHHESNGKVERYIRILEDYLRLTVDKNEDWLKMIPFAEYTINSTPSMALGGASPFEVDVGYVPPSPLTMHYSLEKGGAEADDITEVLDRFANTARVALKATFDRNKLYYDQKRKGDEFEVGDLVFTAQSALVTPGSAHNKELVRSLQTKFVGPFEVIKKDSAVNYRLLLPDYMKRTNLFHISQLRKRNSIPDALIVAPVNLMTSNEFASSSKLNAVVEILDYKKVAKGYNLKARLRDGTESWLRRSDVIRKCPDQYRKFVKNHPEL
jgi:putative transposase